MMSDHYMKHKEHDIEAGRRRASRPDPCKEYKALQDERKRAEERVKPKTTPGKDRNQYTLFGTCVTMKEVRDARMKRWDF